MHRVLRSTRMCSVGVMLIVSTLSAQDNLVANGSFALDSDGNGAPDAWAASGVAGMEQTLTIDAGPDGTKAAKLACTKFVSGSPASHAMVCQSGHVAVESRTVVPVDMACQGTRHANQCRARSFVQHSQLVQFRFEPFFSCRQRVAGV